MHVAYCGTGYQGAKTPIHAPAIWQSLSPAPCARTYPHASFFSDLFGIIWMPLIITAGAHMQGCRFRGKRRR